MEKVAQLHLRELFELDAIDILSARKKGQVIGRTNDLNQSGISVENALRQILQSRLPGAYHIGHGHVVDKTLSSCGQFDVIVADTFANPRLLQTEGDSEYLPVEAVYAVGEIKSQYYKKENPFEKFSKHLQDLHQLQRAEAAYNFFLPSGRGRGVLYQGETSDLRPNKNPFFSFMFFAESGDFKLNHLNEIYKTTERIHLPSVVCFLDSGIIAYGQFAAGVEVTNSFHYTPSNGDIYDQANGTTSRWVYHFNNGSFKHGTHLGWLYFLLASHLHYSTLRPFEPMDYAETVLGGADYHQFGL